MTKKKKNKKQKKKRRLKKRYIFILLVLCLVIAAMYILHRNIKNIYISGNKLVSDEEIIELSELDSYPPYINTYMINIKENVLKNEYIKDVTIRRNISGKIYLDIEEYKPLFIYKDKLVLSSKKMVDNTKNIDYAPYITNNIDEIYDKFIDKISRVDDSSLVKVSHIEYSPTELDKERFLFYMMDNNYVYINLSKMDKLNKYNSIVEQLDGKKGIIYLDSGDYVEIKG